MLIVTEKKKRRGIIRNQLVESRQSASFFNSYFAWIFFSSILRQKLKSRNVNINESDKTWGGDHKNIWIKLIGNISLTSSRVMSP